MTMPATHSAPRHYAFGLRRLAALIGCLCLTAGSVLAQPAQRQATVCIDHYPPFTYFRDGRAEGAMLDALREIGHIVGFELKVTTNTAFARCLRMMEAGKVDFMVSLMPTPERLGYMVMYPYAEPEALRFIARSDFSGEPGDLDQLRSLRVGLINGYEYPKAFEALQATLLAPTPEAGLRLLDAGRIDVLVLNESVADHLVSRPLSDSPNRASSYRLLNTRIFREENVNSIGLSRHSWLIDYNDQLNAAIERLRAEGEFERLIEQHRAHEQAQP